MKKVTSMMVARRLKDPDESIREKFHMICLRTSKDPFCISGVCEDEYDQIKFVRL